MQSGDFRPTRKEGRTYYGIFAAIVRLSMRLPAENRSKSGHRLTLALPHCLDFIDNLYRFGYSIAGQTQNKKIPDFWKDLDQSLDNFARCRFDHTLQVAM
jgi:hypothetical protein